MEDFRDLIKILVELHVSSLPPKEKIINPLAKKVHSSAPPAPRIPGKALKGDAPLSRPSPSSRKKVELSELDDGEIRSILMRHGVDSSNLLSMLSSNRDLRNDLGLGDFHKKNSEYYKRIYKVAAKKSW